jgi:hypothetical protein
MRLHIILEDYVLHSLLFFHRKDRHDSYGSGDLEDRAGRVNKEQWKLARSLHFAYILTLCRMCMVIALNVLTERKRESLLLNMEEFLSVSTLCFFGHSRAYRVLHTTLRSLLLGPPSPPVDSGSASETVGQRQQQYKG